MSKTNKTTIQTSEIRMNSSNEIRNISYSLLKEIGLFVTINSDTVDKTNKHVITVNDNYKVSLKSDIENKNHLRMVEMSTFNYKTTEKAESYCLVVQSTFDITTSQILLPIKFDIDGYFTKFSKLSIFCTLFIDNEINIIENSINNECIKLLIQYSDSRWDQLYINIFSNILYNLSEYKNALINIKKIKSDPSNEMNLIMNNGPLELNKDIDVFSNLIQDEERIKIPQYHGLSGGSTSSHVMCPKCKSNRVDLKIVQDRSGDEGASYYFTCMSEGCGYTWRRRG